MKFMNTALIYIRKTGSFFAKIATAIIAELPRERFFLNPKAKTILKNQKENFKPTVEKHYHRPMSKPASEKQTLLKEKKKA